MRYALISDIHSNLPALEAVLGHLEFQRIDAYICCGDIVGYGPWPNECVNIMKELAQKTKLFMVVGNHDWAAVELEDISKFNEDARQAIIWTRGQLSPENKQYLKELPYILQEPAFTVVHGSPYDPLDEYVLDEKVFKRSLEYLKTELCFIGHTHKPFSFFAGAEMGIGGEALADEVMILLDDMARHMVNIGSVGQPRDSDARACFGIFDDQEKNIIIKRIEYDILKTQEKMKEYGLPVFLVERLNKGI
ncbi:MAG: metallophosphoesterase [bacterium]